MVYVARGSLIDSTSEGVHARNTEGMFFDDDCAVHVRRLAVSGCENPRNSGRQETRFAEQKSDRREIIVSSEKSVSKPMAFKSRDCLARKRNNATSKARIVPGI